MNRPTDTTSEPSRSDDALLNRYQEANAHDPQRPNPALRETVLAHAKTRQPTTPSLPRPKVAANDSQWKIRALGSVAVMGLVGLLVMQFDRGTPEEQVTAFGDPAVQEHRSAAIAPAAPAAASSGAAPSEPVAELAAKATEPLPASPTPAPATHRSAKVAKAKTRTENASADAAPATLADSADTADQAAPIASPAPLHMPMPKASEAEALASAPEPPAMAAASGAALPAEAAPMARAAPAAPVLEGLVAPAPQKKSANEVTAQRQRAAAMATPPANQPPLHTAVAQGDLAAVHRLLEKGLDINARDAKGQTALMVASAGHNQAVLMALLNAGADKALTDRSGLTAADYAEQAGNLDWLPSLQP